MGSGGRMSVSDDGHKSKTVNRAPTTKPSFTLGELKKAIPPHCFNRSLLRSSSYLVVDLAFSALFYYLAANYIHRLPHPLPYVAWPVYWVLQGCVQMGLWVIGHECGHQAFSDYTWLNDTIGYILHTAMLAPYFSWKYSHRKHHANTGSLDHDESFVPKRKSQISPSSFLNTPPGRLLRLTVLVTVGWLLYVCFNVSGRKYERFANHFDPKSPIYNDRERLQIFITDIGLVLASYGVYNLYVAKGLAWLVSIYFAPLVIVYGFLVVITWLHHTHLTLPHYDSTEWDWLRGAIATMDRDYGVLNTVLHHITDTHVAHHLFSTIPHYHAMEATNAIKPILGEYYRYDNTPIIKAMWREATECFYVEADEAGEDGKNKGVFWFNNKK